MIDDTEVGTLRYMAPEAFDVSQYDAKVRLKTFLPIQECFSLGGRHLGMWSASFRSHDG